MEKKKISASDIKVKDIKHEKCVRKTFSKIGDYIEIPNLLKVQKDSYEWFVKEGLGEVLKDISPIIDYSWNLVLEFFDYYMEDKTKYTLEESKERDATYSTRLHVKVRLINRETGEIKEQEIYLGDFPVMTDKYKEKWRDSIWRGRRRHHWRGIRCCFSRSYGNNQWLSRW